MARESSNFAALSLTAAPHKVLPLHAAFVIALLVLLVGWVPNPALAQDDPATADEDTTAFDDFPDQSGGSLQDAFESAQSEPENQSTSYQGAGQDLVDGGFFSTFTNSPKAGGKATNSQYGFYSHWDSYLKMVGASSFSNNAKWSQDEYRKQDKRVEKRTLSSTYNAGTLLPFTLSASGNWNWTEDVTTNTAGNENLSKRDIRTGMVTLTRNGIVTGPFSHNLRGGVGINIQDAVTQNKKNDFNEANVDGGLRTRLNLAPGLTAVGRVYGKNVSGEGSLGESTSPSSATTDSLGFGVYFKRGLSSSSVSVTRGNFERKFLAFRTDAFGLIDTAGRDDKIIEELETNDALDLKVSNVISLGRFKFDTTFSHVTSNRSFAQAAVGLKEKSADLFHFGTTYTAGKDSIVVDYDYRWTWDDHLPNGQEYRGRQYVKDRKLSLLWQRLLFRKTIFLAKYETSLLQDIAQHEHNANDKDSVGHIINLRAERKWDSGFRASLLFGYKTSQELSIRGSRSANNNQKDSYEVSPGYTWTITEWLAFTQNYRLYIQYTDYLFSYLDYVDKEGNYNKRGNLNTRVTIKPTSRLTLTVKHDFNRRFNATETSIDALGHSFYSKDQVQDISKLDFALVFSVAEGVTLEGATYRTRDDKETFGSRGKETQTLGGEVWVGSKVSKKWGDPKKSNVELSMRVKKVNAYGPSVSKESSDYWDADVWLKWSF